MKSPRLYAAALLALIAMSAAAKDKPQFKDADAAWAAYDAHVSRLRKDFESQPGDGADKEWVKKKLAYMAAVDQYSHNFPHQLKLPPQEFKRFEKVFGERTKNVLPDNTKELKKLLATHPWFKISEWGEETAANAWIIVQHATEDLEFQADVLKRLEKLVQDREVSRKKYAFLYDRVAVLQKRPQTYGTQGYCSGPGEFTACPLTEPNDPVSVAARRAEMGIEPASLEEYKSFFVKICRQAADKPPCG